MTRRLRLLAVVVAGVAVAAVVVALLLRASGPEPTPMPRFAGGMAARGTLSPRSYTFGEQLFARVDVLLDRSVFDPDEITLDTQFAPFAERATHVARRDYDELTRLRYTIELECLTKDCVPDTIEKPIQFAPLIVEHQGTAIEDVSWPRFSIVARVRQSSISALAGSDWRGSPVVERPSYRVQPTLLAALLVVGALGLYVAAGVLVVAGSAGLTRRWRRLRLTPLERALAVLERANAGGIEAEQRLALDRLADELRSRGEGDLALTARRLAWAEDTPAPDRTARLSTGVRELLHGRSNGRG